MTAVAVDTYSHGHFQRLPTLEKARADYLQANGDLLVEKTFKDFFVEAGMETTFGLVMLHRHFDIMPEQKMVEYRGTSSPWVTIAGMTELKPTVWAFDEDTRLRPTEFRYTREDTREVSFGQAELRFIASLREKLVAHGLMELFGLARYPGDDFPGSCEITQGSANINLHPNDVSLSFSTR